MVLRGLKLNSNKMVCCNTIDEDNSPKCADHFDMGGNHIQFLNALQLTGNEDWFYDEKTNSFCFHAFNKYYDEDNDGSKDTMMCTHFAWVSGGVPTKHGEFSGGTLNEIRFYYNERNEVLEEFVEWIKSQVEKGTPVIVYYIMKEPIYHGKISHFRTTTKTMSELRESKKRMMSGNKQY